MDLTIMGGVVPMSITQVCCTLCNLNCCYFPFNYEKTYLRLFYGYVKVYITFRTLSEQNNWALCGMTGGVRAQLYAS